MKIPAAEHNRPTPLDVSAFLMAGKIPGGIQGPMEHTVLVLARRYVTSRRKLGAFAPTTAQTYRYALAAFAAFVDDRPIEKVTRRHVEKYIEAQRADATKRAQLSAVKNFLEWCVECGYLARNPAVGVRGPKASQRVPKAIPAPAIGDVFLACPDARGRLILLLMVQEGLRAAEVAGARRDAIDYEDMLITVMGKGQKERVLPISEETATALFDYLSEEPGPTGPLIRSTVTGRGISPGYVSKLVVQWMKEAGVKRAPYDGRSGHALRHSCATDMADKGVDLRVIADVLGHSHLSTVELYTKRRKAHGPLREALGGRTYQRTDVA